ncbi:hypothetical protein [Psychrobacillus lasiicapitis]|nr:hypothetical protein [Psychrobacillus lasiicapitis]GGA40583.1 hypothetical protein GCM10011384_32780 [Psychrobacillus lasiicapitis]
MYTKKVVKKMDQEKLVKRKLALDMIEEWMLKLKKTSEFDRKNE